MIAFDLNKLIQHYGSAEAAAKALIEQIGVSYFILGALSCRLKEDVVHVDCGYPNTLKGFSAYAEERFSLKPSTSQLLMRIYRILLQAGIETHELSGTCYSRMRLLVMLPVSVLRSEKNSWLDLARDLSSAKLDVKVREKLSTLNPGRKAGRPAKKSNRCGGIAHGRHVSRDDYRKLLTEREDLALENEKLRAALDVPELTEAPSDDEITRLNKLNLSLYKESFAKKGLQSLFLDLFFSKYPIFVVFLLNHYVVPKMKFF